MDSVPSLGPRVSDSIPSLQRTKKVQLTVRTCRDFRLCQRSHIWSYPLITSPGFLDRIEFVHLLPVVENSVLLMGIHKPGAKICNTFQVSDT